MAVKETMKSTEVIKVPENKRSMVVKVTTEFGEDKTLPGRSTYKAEKAMIKSGKETETLWPEPSKATTV